MESAIFGLVGVLLGGFLTTTKEWWFQKRKNQKDIEYLAVQIITRLDRFIGQCSDVVNDDGLFQGGYNNDGYRSPQITLPKFEPQSVDVEWKSLPVFLMYEILDFPNQIERANNSINGEFEYISQPPDYSEGFVERQYQYCLLGINASKLSTQLRKLSDFPKNIHDIEVIDFMQTKVLLLDKLRNNENEQ